MEHSFYVDIISPEKKVFEGEISSLVVPAELGYLGVLANHAPLVANLVPGKISFRKASGEQTVIRSQGKGFLEVLKNKVVLLLEKSDRLS